MVDLTPGFSEECPHLNLDDYFVSSRCPFNKVVNAAVSRQMLLYLTAFILKEPPNVFGVNLPDIGHRGFV